MKFKAAAVTLAISIVLAGCYATPKRYSGVQDDEAIKASLAVCSAPGVAVNALTFAQRGMANIETECTVFFDSLAKLTQNGRFASKALNSSNLAAPGILKAAKVSADNIAILSGTLTLSQALFNAFVEQYAFSPYLYKIREITFQAMSKYALDNALALAKLEGAYGSDDYCRATIFVQRAATICSISYIQMLFDQQVASPSKIVTAGSTQTPGSTPSAATGRAASDSPFLRLPPGYTPLVSPSYTIQ